eukprot:maker-scaffold1070_size64748-snap-gene-0.14 protein:Tk03037 transcript:maker-scaffold1070_size64748-snap-gene-0.14-mRNA-1 annotation:"synembryn"
MFKLVAVEWKTSTLIVVFKVHLAEVTEVRELAAVVIQEPIEAIASAARFMRWPQMKTPLEQQANFGTDFEDSGNRVNTHRSTMDIDIAEFIAQHQNVGEPLGLSKDEKKALWTRIIGILRDDAQTIEHWQALSALKVLSREKTHLDDLIDESTINQLLKFTGIAPDLMRKAMNDQTSPVIAEAQRCLHNLLLQSGVARAFCAKNETLPGVMNLVNSSRDLGIPPSMLMFDIKIAFLITALCQETRKVLYLEHRGVPRLLTLTNYLISNAKGREVPKHPILSDEEVDVINEVLRLLFNITLGLDQNNMDEEERANLNELSDTVQSLLTIDTETADKKIALHDNCVNVLSYVPSTCTDPLLKNLKTDIAPPNVIQLEYDGFGMNATQAMLEHLLYKIDHPDSTLREAITPVVFVLCSLSRHHRPIRKFLRAKILPPLKDVSQRPEVGQDARNKLCKLLTSSTDSVAKIVAELLFILCKESVSRFVKYSGYGNAAGLLARRGLMLGGKGDNAGNYSAEEEDSDTEEYLESAHKVNPIVGCVEPERPSPFEGMSEEQKEYEAVKLANLIHDLHNMGVVKPAIPGPDGRPQEVEHVLELQEAGARNFGRNVEANHNSDSD